MASPAAPRQRPTRSPRWPTLQAFQGSRVLSDGQRNITTMGDEVVCTDPVTGAKLWSVQLAGDLARAGGSLAAPPAAAGGRLFVATLAGEVLQMSPETGAIERRYPVGAPVRSQPVIDGGWIYVGTEDGRLVAIDTKDAALTGWPMWGGNAARTGIAAK